MEVILLNLLNMATLGFLGIYRYRRRTRSFMEPGILFAILLAIMYPIRSLLLFAFGYSALPLYPAVEDPENLAEVAWLSFIGSLGYVVGYLIILGRRRLQILAGSDKQRHIAGTTTCIVFFAAGVMGIVYKIATNDYISYLMGQQRIEGLTQFANILTSMQWPAFIGVWLLFFSGNRHPRFLLLFGVVNAVIVPYQFIQGSKTFLSLLLLSVLLAYYWQRGKLPKLTVIVAVTFISMFVFPFVHSFRETVNLEYGEIPALSKLNFSFLQDVALGTGGKSDSGAAPLVESLALVSQRFGGADELYNLTKMIPALLPYRMGEAYLAIPVSFVPRAIWPDKPIFSRGAMYGAALGTITSVTPFPYGEAYWDGGMFGLPLFMGFWGVSLALLVKGFEKLYQNLRYRFFIAAFFLSQLHWIAGSETSMPMVLSGLPQQVAILGALYWVVRNLVRREKRVADSLQRKLKLGETMQVIGKRMAKR